MRLAIIGCGYVGSAVARRWHDRGDIVTVTTTSPDKQDKLQNIASEVVVTTGDDLATLKRVVADKEVVLLSVGAKQRSVEAYQQAYLETAKNAIAAIRATKSVKQLIYTSSYGILGDRAGGVVDETATPNPKDEYGEMLAKTEATILSVPETEFKTCILRLSGIYGEGRELIKIFGKMSGMTRPGNGQRYSNWVHLEDIVGAIDFAKEKQLQGVYHLASEEVLTVKEFLRRLFEAHNLPGVTWDDTDEPLRYNMVLSNQKIKDAGYRFVYPKIKFN